MGNDTPIFQFIGPFGVPVQVGRSLLLLPLIFISFGGGLTSMAYDMAIVAMLIGSIFLHELGHAGGCLVQGVPVRRIMIHGGGGFCEHARSPSYTEQELIVAMGPIVNLAIWALASLAAPMVGNVTLAWGLYMFTACIVASLILSLLTERSLHHAE